MAKQNKAPTAPTAPTAQALVALWTATEGYTALAGQSAQGKGSKSTPRANDWSAHGTLSRATVADRASVARYWGATAKARKAIREEATASGTIEFLADRFDACDAIPFPSGRLGTYLAKGNSSTSNPVGGTCFVSSVGAWHRAPRGAGFSVAHAVALDALACAEDIASTVLPSGFRVGDLRYGTSFAKAGNAFLLVLPEDAPVAALALARVALRVDSDSPTGQGTVKALASLACVILANGTAYNVACADKRMDCAIR